MALYSPFVRIGYRSLRWNRSWSWQSALPRRPIPYRGIALLTELCQRVGGYYCAPPRTILHLGRMRFSIEKEQLTACAIIIAHNSGFVNRLNEIYFPVISCDKGRVSTQSQNTCQSGNLWSRRCA